MINLESNIQIEVIKIDKAFKHEKLIMSLSEWKSLKKEKGFNYYAYQLGFSQYS